ncbi:MAG: glycosyltransferase involved in cell wall biosynthesis [Granulosicoccus sp.]|jgi:glycosyltransferase involved in cell wall biosynthesis
MHVLFVPNAYPNAEFPYRGIFFKDLVLALKEVGVKVGVAYLDIRPFAEQDLKSNPINIELEDGYPVVSKRDYNRIPLGSQYQRKTYEQVVSNLVDRYIQDNGTPDLIHAHVGLWAGWSVSEYCVKHNLKYVLTEHSSTVLANQISNSDQPYLSKAYDRADHLFAVSEALGNSMRSYCENAVSVVPNAVNVEFFAGDFTSDKSEIIRFITVATLDDNKGVELMIRAIAELKKKGIGIELEVVGVGPKMNDFQKIGMENGVNDEIHFHGRQPKEEIKGLFQQSNVFVSASKQETFGVAIVEAMAAGLPVITTKSGGPEDIVTPETGVLAERSVDGLADRMKWMCANLDQFDPAEISSRAMEQYSKEKVAGLYLNHYRKIVS